MSSNMWSNASNSSELNPSLVCAIALSGVGLEGEIDVVMAMRVKKCMKVCVQAQHIGLGV
jgi:hypothetical protein